MNEFKKLDGRAMAAVIALATCAVILIIDLVVTAQVSELFDQLKSKDMDPTKAEALQERAQGLEERANSIANTYRLTVLITAVFFVRWMMRAYSNIPAIYSDYPTRFTGKQVGWAFFIPFINLVRPYYAMSDIWAASGPDDGSAKPRGAAIIGLWWALFLIGGVLGNVAMRMAASTDIDTIKLALTVNMGADVIFAGAAVTAILAVRKITANQAKKSQQPRVEPEPAIADQGNAP